MKFKWKRISATAEHDDCVVTSRAKVFGGWIVKNNTWIKDGLENECISQSMVFVPDIKHEWIVEED